MLSLIGSVLSLLAPLFKFLIEVIIKNQESKARMVKNYYRFLAQIDKKSSTKVANYLAAEEALRRVQMEIKERELEEPERPTEKPVVEKEPYEIPEIQVLDVKVKTKGDYITKSGQAKGLVVHYTAGRSNKGKKDALRTLTGLAKRGLACLVMDKDGVIYRAKNQDLNEIGWHAGKSVHLGHKGVSRYCMGMEICCAGKLEDDGKTWFGERVPPEEIRQVTKGANQKEGAYMKYTAAQEKALVNFVLWQLDVNPDFDLDWVIGHDECAPNRKSDPGGSLSMTMPQFREMIRARM